MNLSPEHVVMPPGIWKHPVVSIYARIVWGYLAMRQGRNATAWPNVLTIARELRLGDKTVRRAIADLERAQLVGVERVNGRGNRYCVMYPTPVAETALSVSTKVGETALSEGTKVAETADPGLSDQTPRSQRPPTTVAETSVTLSCNPLNQPSQEVVDAAATEGMEINERFDPLAYHPAHPVVSAGLEAWGSTWTTLADGKRYVGRGHVDKLAMGRLAHWLERHCAVNGGDPASLIAQIAADFLRTRWGATRPAMAWLDPDASQYPFDPDAWLLGPPATRQSGATKRGPIFAPDASEHDDPTDASEIDFNDPKALRIQA